MIFKKEDIPFFNELNKTDCIICKDNKEYRLYDAPTWEIAQKVDAFMGNESLGFEIEDYIVNKNINI